MNQWEKNAMYDAQRAREREAAARWAKTNAQFEANRQRQEASRRAETAKFEAAAADRRQRENQRIFNRNLEQMRANSAPRPARKSKDRIRGVSIEDVDPSTSQKTTSVGGSFIGLAVVVLFFWGLMDSKTLGEGFLVVSAGALSLYILYRMRFIIATILKFAFITGIVVTLLYFFFHK